MKTKTIILSAILTIAIFGAFNVHIESNNVIDSTTLTNIEALAEGEGGGDFLCIASHADYCVYGDLYVINVKPYHM